MAGEGELENEWNRLSWFSTIWRGSTADPEDVEAARCVSDGVEEHDLAFEDNLLLAWFCSGDWPSGRLERSEPKLRVHDGETAYLRRE